MEQRDWIGVALAPVVGAGLGLIGGLGLLVTLLIEGAPVDGGGGDPLLNVIPLAVLGGVVAGVVLLPGLAAVQWGTATRRLQRHAVVRALGVGGGTLVAVFVFANGGDIGVIAIPIVLALGYGAFWFAEQAAERLVADRPDAGGRDRPRAGGRSD